ncbi:MAG: DUF368 domain-containing protein, partial [Bacteroidia bacterium]|nr:DUF368 domain-containing protein [Bacteroidia bacterium]
PGVSGGTIAFITGIYEKLLATIKAFHPSLVGTFRSDGISGVWKKINGTFLFFLLIGMGIGLGGGAFVITYLLETYPPIVWSFFFGLIISSVVYVGSKITVWSWKEIVFLILGTALAFFITVATPAQGSQSTFMIFISGFIAITALILPGISGSFMLLLMGMYTFILGSVKEALKTQAWEHLKVFVVFGCGAVLGLVIFSRVLTWLFKYYRDLTLAILTGFMLGSLNKIWPWRNVLSTRVNRKGVEVPFLEENVMPDAYFGEPFVFGVIISMIIGILIVLVLSKFDKQTIEE